MPIILPIGVKRFDFMEYMKSQGIQTSIHYPPIHKFSGYANIIDHNNPEIPITEDVALREVRLPLFPSLKLSEVEFIVHHIQEGLNRS